MILWESAEVMADVKSFHFDVTGQLELESSDSRISIPITYEGDSVAPNRTRARLTLSVIVFVLQMDIIMIGEEAWTHQRPNRCVAGGADDLDWPSQSRLADVRRRSGPG